MQYNIAAAAARRRPNGDQCLHSREQKKERPKQQDKGHQEARDFPGESRRQQKKRLFFAIGTSGVADRLMKHIICCDATTIEQGSRTGVEHLVDFKCRSLNIKMIALYLLEETW